MSIRSYLTVKQRDLPELKTIVSSSVAEMVKTKVKRTIGVKRATDREGDSSESQRGDENTYIMVHDTENLIFLQTTTRIIHI